MSIKDVCKNNCDIFLIGTGDLGSWVVEILSRLPGMEHKKIVVGDYNEESARKRAFSAWSGTSFFGMSPEIKSEKVDLFNIDETGELLRKYNPRVIVNTTSLQSWWVVDELPKDLWAKMETEAGLGPWIPMHLTLTYYLMQAIKKYEIKAHVVNTSFPDLTNPVLGKIGLAPTCGIGNGDLLVPGITRGVAEKLDISPRNITVYMVAQHSHDMQFSILGVPGSPYYVKIMVGDKDVTNQFNTDELIMAGVKDWFSGRQLHPLVASSVARNAWNFLFDTGRIASCVPGPLGEIGGYPARITPNGLTIELPEGITMEEARKINEESQKKDGVERIKEDGTIVFTDQSHQLMKEIMGYDCKTLKITESKERYKELLAKYAELKKKYNISQN